MIGKVQGVWFRKSTKEMADKLGVSGYVRNRQDGSVHIEAEGETDALEDFVEWCHEGPDLADVSEVVHRETDPKGDAGFLIQY